MMNYITLILAFLLHYNLGGCAELSLLDHPNDSIDKDMMLSPLMKVSKSDRRRPELETSHVMMIDAGSSGTRLHIFEYSRRLFTVLPPPLSYPLDENSHWTSRVAPGIDVFAAENDDDLVPALSVYLSPFITWTKTILKDKESSWGEYPIYLKATGGMRALTTSDRIRVIAAVRSLFGNNEFSPFAFEDEQVRVISGEEEAIYGWTGINFLMGTLLNNTQGIGTVTGVNKTFGALDMGGASTQISFFEPSEDIMSNLFKMQLGASKHWNVYAHSFLYFGVNLALERVKARIVFNYETGKSEDVDDSKLIYNPCLPGKYVEAFESSIWFNPDGIESWGETPKPYSVTFSGGESGGDFEECSNLARTLLRKNTNEWCKFEHKGDCSFAGVYQPPLPTQSRHFGEFFGFSNYLKVWKFLRLQPRSTLAQLQKNAQQMCSFSAFDLDEYIVGGGGATAGSADFCFLACYSFELLHNGYGFKLDDHITVANVINGQKVGWALGSALYEINALPWEYDDGGVRKAGVTMGVVIFFTMLGGVIVSLQVYKLKRELAGLKFNRKGAKGEVYGALL